MSWQGTVEQLRQVAGTIEREAPITLAAFELLYRVVALAEARNGDGESFDAIAEDAQRILTAAEFGSFEGHPEG